MKYYAVKVGRSTGIFNSWGTCKEQVLNYSGAIYKSFESREEAERYLDSEEPGKDINSNLPFAFIDGSYSRKNSLYGWGGYIDNYGDIHIIQGTGSASDYIKYRNITGEVRGALEVIKQAINLGIPELNLYYDYAGIENWASESWKCNNDLSKFYQRYYLQRRSKVKINFIHVKGHTGNTGNTIADLLAKEIVGAKLRKKDTAMLQNFKQRGAINGSNSNC